MVHESLKLLYRLALIEGCCSMPSAVTTTGENDTAPSAEQSFTSILTSLYTSATLKMRCPQRDPSPNLMYVVSGLQI